MKRTEQQEAVIEWFRSGTDDLCVTARAGSGKTTTLIDGVCARPMTTSATLCSFNRRIADEITTRLQSSQCGRAQAKTLHGLGYRAITRALNRAGRRLVVNQHREAEIALRILGQAKDAEEEARWIGRLAAFAKETSPDDITEESLCEMAIDNGLAESDDDDEDSWVLARSRARVALDVVHQSLEITGEISYSDMLWLPLVKRWSPDQVDLVCVDEAQDMSRAQLRLAAMARLRGGRMVVVGDDRQGIYSFRGAEPGSLERVATSLRARRMSLTVTFRCGAAIAAEAARLVPDIRAAPGAPDGVVRDAAESEMMAMARPGDFVLSRTNAPLARVCLGLIRAGVRAFIVGSDIGAGLIKLVEKLAPKGACDDPVTEMLVRLGKWRDREIAKAHALKRERRAEQVDDQAAMIVALSTDVDDISSLVDTIERIFRDDGGPRVACSTVHRAKGLEADRVWILADTLDAIKGRTALEELEEQNIRYVAITRARHELVWIR